MYLFAASSAALGLPSSALDVSCFPREPMHVGTPERAAGSVPVTATVLPQLSTGPAASPSASTVRLLEWTEAAAPPSGSGLRVSNCGDWRDPASRRCGAGWKLGELAKTVCVCVCVRVRARACVSLFLCVSMFLFHSADCLYAVRTVDIRA